MDSYETNYKILQKFYKFLFRRLYIPEKKLFLHGKEIFEKVRYMEDIVFILSNISK